MLTVSSRAPVEACDRLGVDTETLSREVGLSRQTLEDPDARLQGSQAGELWAKAYQLSRDPFLSLHAAEACPLGAYKVIGGQRAHPGRSLQVLGPEGVARELGQSARSLQRHLRELGYSYNTLSDEVRQATACLYLAQPDIAIAEVAYLLGFADQSTFNRSFKRWTGCTPKQVRQRGGQPVATTGGHAAQH